MIKDIIKYIGGLLAFLIIFAGCDSSINSHKEPVNNKTESSSNLLKPVTDPDLRQTLAEVKSATAAYHNLKKAENAGYHQESPFVPDMGYHYVNFGLVDADIVPAQPEALVFIDKPGNGNKRRLAAVEYVIPFAFIAADSPVSALDNKFPGVDGDKWHADEEIGAWTLHAWIWYNNPEGIFHATNPRVGS